MGDLEHPHTVGRPSSARHPAFCVTFDVSSQHQFRATGGHLQHDGAVVDQLRWQVGSGPVNTDTHPADTPPGWGLTEACRRRPKLGSSGAQSLQ